MGKIAVIYWSAGGNTEAMAKAIARGISSENVGVDVFSVSEFGSKSVNDYEKLALGCPSMGAEVLEECEFEPFLSSVEHGLAGEKVALFGSYGWGDGEWMRNWEEQCIANGAVMAGEGVICNEAPDDTATEQCVALGKALAS